MGKGHSTALHYAVQRKAINAIEALLVRGANVHIKQRGQRTPLGRNMPPTLDRIPIRDLLISYGANPGGR
jgi:hypothetical protein